MKDDFDRRLAEALSRRDPPPWLEAKIMAAVERGVEPARATQWPRRFALGLRLRWVSAALATVLVFTGVAWQRERMERERGQQAAARLEQALKLTSAKLRKIQQIVNASAQQ